MKAKTLVSTGAALAAALTFSVYTAPAHALVLTFDDISTAEEGVIPDGYGGLNWTNMSFIKTPLSVFSGYEAGVVSGTYVAYNRFGAIASVVGSSFDFNGAYLTAAWNNGLNILIEGLSGGTVIYSETVVVDTTAPTWFDFDFNGIDLLRFTSFGGTDAGYGGFGTHFAMDNFTINENGETEVPEPATLALLGAGLAGLGLVRRRKV